LCPTFSRQSDDQGLHLAQHSREPGWDSVHRRQCRSTAQETVRLPTLPVHASN
jgi:hypothetical protein